MKLEKVNHVGVRSLDKETSKAFYIGILGLVPHRTKDNWLQTQDGQFSVHLMPGTEKSNPGNDDADLARHFAFQSNDLEGVVDDLLKAGLRPFQGTLDTKHRKELTDSSDLTFGIGTIFVFDPDGNLVEFVDPRRGIFPEVLSEA